MLGKLGVAGLMLKLSAIETNILPVLEGWKRHQAAVEPLLEPVLSSMVMMTLPVPLYTKGVLKSMVSHSPSPTTRVPPLVTCVMPVTDRGVLSESSVVLVM